MKLHFMGKYDQNPASLPCSRRRPGAVRFREPKDAKQRAMVVNILGVELVALFGALAFLRCRMLRPEDLWQITAGCAAALLASFPRVFLHVRCFRGDVYLYTDWRRGRLLVVGPESMSKRRFLRMMLLPNVAFGLLPYLTGMIFPRSLFLLAMGTLGFGTGAEDYYTAYNALTQVPKGARVYCYRLHFYWYWPR